jgi:hypothetical protein
MARAGLLPYGHEEADMSVSKYFASGIPSAVQAHYAPMAGSAVTQHDVYYLGDIFMPEEILHEATGVYLPAGYTALYANPQTLPEYRGGQFCSFLSEPRWVPQRLNHCDPRCGFHQLKLRPECRGLNLHRDNWRQRSQPNRQS